MATFISVSGPSVTGKTSLIDSLCSYKEMYNCVFSPDFKDVVWSELTSKGIFSEFTDITTDSSYMCTYLHKLIDTYNEYIESHDPYDDLIILDGSWIDYFIYAHLNMWYNRVISSAQEEVFSKILKHSNKISRYYFTEARDDLYPLEKFRVRGKITTFKLNRPLEIALYKAHSNLSGAASLYHSNIVGSSLEIIEDLKKLGYL